MLHLEEQNDWVREQGKYLMYKLIMLPIVIVPNPTITILPEGQFSAGLALTWLCFLTFTHLLLLGLNFFPLVHFLTGFVFPLPLHFAPDMVFLKADELCVVSCVFLSKIRGYDISSFC